MATYAFDESYELDYLSSVGFSFVAPATLFICLASDQTQQERTPGARTACLRSVSGRFESDSIDTNGR